MKLSADTPETASSSRSPAPIVADVSSLTINELLLFIRVSAAKPGRYNRDDLIALLAVCDRLVRGGVYWRDPADTPRIFDAIGKSLQSKFAAVGIDIPSKGPRSFNPFRKKGG